MTANEYMMRAAELARRGKGYTRTNPCVGAVVVRDGDITGEGWHTAYGAPHAEVEALSRAGETARGADLYVTLEPCTTYGKTPPCSLAIINSGVKRIFVGVLDPNPQHAGGALKALQGHGIEIKCGIEAGLCASLIEDFTKFKLTGRPYVTVKIAQSLDGKIAAASGESKWITGPESRREVHRLRKESDAVLVGIGTVLADNPELTVRDIPSDRQPARVVLDSACRIPLGSKLVTGATAGTADTILFTTDRAPSDKVSQLRNCGVKVIITDDLSAHGVLAELGSFDIMNVLVEGGSAVFGSFLSQGQADMLHLFIAPILIGGDRCRGSIGGSGAAFLKDAQRVVGLACSRTGDDLWLRGKLRDHTAEVLELTCKAGSE